MRRLAVKKIKIMIRITDMLYGVKSKSFENVISLVLNTSRKNFMSNITPISYSIIK